MVSHGISWVSMGLTRKYLGLQAYVHEMFSSERCLSIHPQETLFQEKVRQGLFKPPSRQDGGGEVVTFGQKKKRQMACKPGSVLRLAPNG
jgi:hypothetical protein